MHDAPLEPLALLPRFLELAEEVEKGSHAASMSVSHAPLLGGQMGNPGTKIIFNFARYGRSVNPTYNADLVKYFCDNVGTRENVCVSLASHLAPSVMSVSMSMLTVPAAFSQQLWK